MHDCLRHPPKATQAAWACRRRESRWQATRQGSAASAAKPDASAEAVKKIRFDITAVLSSLWLRRVFDKQATRGNRKTAAINKA